MKRIGYILIACLFLFQPFCLSVSAAVEVNEENQSYLYDYWKNVVYAPDAYALDQIVDLSEITGNPVALEDIRVSPDGGMFVLDRAGGVVVELDSHYTVVNRYSEYGGRPFKQPEGIFVTEQYLYVANTGDRNVVVLQRDGTPALVIEDPGEDCHLFHPVF